MGGIAYAAPRSLDEALAVLAERGPETSILAGGMIVVSALKQGTLAARHIMNIKALGLPSDPEMSPDELAIGALVCHRRVEGDAAVGARLPALQELERNAASVQIRNHGTLVGNLCAAEPWTDLPCLMAALGARLRLASARQRREVAADDWILAPATTRRRPDEMVLAIGIPLPKDAEGFGYSRLTLRQGLAPPVACAAARLALARNGAIASARVFLGAVGPRPQRLASIEAMLTGEVPSAISPADIDNAVSRDVECLADQRCSSGYKKQVAGVLVRRAVADAVADAGRQRP